MRDVKELTRIFKVLADETRLRMLKILEKTNGLCVCEIMDILDISQSRASRNLGELKNVGFITDKRDGPWVIYSINNEVVNGYHIHLCNLVKEWLNDDEIIENDKKKLKKVVKTSKRACGKI